MKFKIGDKVTPAEDCVGFKDAIIIGTVEIKGKPHYIFKIMNGRATVPFTVDDNYKLVNDV